MIRLRSMGDCLLETGSSRITPDMDVLFATALYLAIERGREVQRGELAELLWPAMPQKNAHHCLRQTLYRLRGLGVAVTSSRSALQIPAELLDTDYHLLFEEGSARRDAAADIAARPFLPGYSPRFSDGFDEWLERQRDMVNAAARRLLVGELERSRRDCEWSRVEKLARTVLQVDPLNEEAVLALAEAHARHGSKALALRVLDRYVAEAGFDNQSLHLPASRLRKRIVSGRPEQHTLQPDEVPLVGRDDDLATIEQCLQRAKLGSGGSVLIWGEPGIGKTRFATELGMAAAIHGFSIAQTSVRWNDEDRPFAAFADLLPQLTSMPGALGSSPDSLHYLRRITAPNLEGNSPSPEAHHYQALYSRLRSALLDLLDAVVAETPLVMLIDDAQWLDEASIDFCGTIVEFGQHRKLLLLLASRIDGLGSRRVLPQQALVHHLRPLSDTESEELVNRILEHTGIPRPTGFPRWCIQYGEGNPFRLQELALRTVVRANKLRPPTSISSMLAARIASIPKSARRTLGIISLLGRYATIDRLERLLSGSTSDLLDAVAILEETGLVKTQADRIAPRHDLVREIALDGLTPGVRALIHRRLAGSLMDEASVERSVELTWEAAQHWIAAGESETAVDFLRVCSRHCLELANPQKSIEILRTALSWCTEKNARSEIEIELAKALWISGSWEEVLETTNVALHRRVTGKHQHDELELINLEASLRLGRDLPVTLEQLMNCTISGASPDHRLRAAASAIIITDNTLDESAARSAHAAVCSLLDFESESFYSSCLVELVFHTMLGEPQRALTAADLLIDRAQRRSLQPELFNALRYSAIARLHAGRVDDALGLSLEAFRMANSVSVPLQIAAANQLLWIELYLDRLSEARMWLDRGRAMASEIPALRSNLAINAAELAWRCGDAEWCRSEVQSAAEHQAVGGALRGHLRVAAMRVLACLLERSAPPRGDLALLNEHQEKARRFKDLDLVTAALVAVAKTQPHEELARISAMQYWVARQGETHPVSPTLQRVVLAT